MIILEIFCLNLGKNQKQWSNGSWQKRKTAPSGTSIKRSPIKNHMNKILLSIILLAIITLSGCGKKLSGITWNFRDKTSLDVRQINYDYFTGKAKIEFKDGDIDINAKANIRMKKDSLIWINFSSVGIQGARCLINRDSITLINLMKKEYQVFYYDSLSEKFNFDINFESIQATALGNLIIERREDDNVERKENFFILKQVLPQVVVDNFINRKTMKIERVEMREPQTVNKATIIYRDFHVLDDDKAFPFSAAISLFYTAEFNTLNTIVNFEYNKAEFQNKELKFPFSIHPKYVRK